MCHRLVRWPPGEEPDPLDTAAALTAHPPMMKPQKVQALTVLGQMHDSGLAHLGRQPQVREQPNQMRERILGLPTAPAHDHHGRYVCRCVLMTSLRMWSIGYGLQVRFIA